MKIEGAIVSVLLVLCLTGCLDSQRTSVADTNSIESDDGTAYLNISKEVLPKGVDIDDIRIIRWDLPSYVQITKCLSFTIKWLENLAKRRG